MKMWSFTKKQILILSLCGYFNSQLQAKELPYILEVQKNATLYDRPSLKGKKVANAEAGTTLLYVEKSKKGLWVKLKDADGIEGWIPIQGTDYKDVAAERMSSEKIQEISRLEDLKTRKEQRPKSVAEQQREILAQKAAREKENFNPTLRIAPLVRWLSDSEPKSKRIGLRIDYNLGHLALEGQNRLGQAWLAAEGTFPAPQVRGSDYTAAVRYVGRAPLWGPIQYGPDLGYSVDNVKSKFRSHASLGLSVGPAMGPFDLMFRGAYDFFARSRAILEVQIGASF